MGREENEGESTERDEERGGSVGEDAGTEDFPPSVRVPKQRKAQAVPTGGWPAGTLVLLKYYVKKIRTSGFLRVLEPFLFSRRRSASIPAARGTP